jgi:capsular polysaccharide biosynthesis protein
MTRDEIIASMTDMRNFAHDNPDSEIKFHLDYPEICRLRPPPRFWLGSATPDVARWYFNDRCTPPCGVFQALDVTIFGVAVIEKDGKFLEIPQNGLHQSPILHDAESYFAEPHTIEKIDQPVVLLNGPAYGIYGHWLIDFMPRLLLVARRIHNWKQLTYMVPDNLPQFGFQWLSFLGIPPANIIKYQTRGVAYRLREAIIPTTLRGDGRPALPMKFLKNFILAQKGPQNNFDNIPIETFSKRFYVSRTKYGNTSRQSLNYADVEALFEERGFQIVYPETMSIPEQILLFARAEQIAGEYGSGLHNTIFSNPGTKIMVLRGNKGHPGFLQSGIGEVMDQPTGYIFGETDESSGAQKTVFSLDDVRLGLDIAFSGALW